MPVQSQDMDIQSYKWWSFCVFNGLRLVVIVRFVDIGGIVDHHCLNSFKKKTYELFDNQWQITKRRVYLRYKLSVKMSSIPKENICLLNCII